LYGHLWLVTKGLNLSSTMSRSILFKTKTGLIPSFQACNFKNEIKIFEVVVILKHLLKNYFCLRLYSFNYIYNYNSSITKSHRCWNLAKRGKSPFGFLLFYNQVFIILKRRKISKITWKNQHVQANQLSLPSTLFHWRMLAMIWHYFSLWYPFLAHLACYRGTEADRPTWNLSRWSYQAKRKSVNLLPGGDDSVTCNKRICQSSLAMINMGQYANISHPRGFFLQAG